MNTTTTTGAAQKKAVPKVPEVLLKKRKLYADLKARRLRAQVQETKVIVAKFLNSSRTIFCLAQEIQTFSDLQTCRKIRQRIS